MVLDAGLHPHIDAMTLGGEIIGEKNSVSGAAGIPRRPASGERRNDS
jgi:hypothetical protein